MNIRYDKLVGETVAVDLGADVNVQVLKLEAIIAVKEETGRLQDLAMLPVLRRTLEEKRRG